MAAVTVRECGDNVVSGRVTACSKMSRDYRGMGLLWNTRRGGPMN